MPVSQIGQINISYTVRYSNRAKLLRIIVTPKGVEAVAPNNTPIETITAFVDSKHRWLLKALEHCRPKYPPANPESYITGAKVMYQGRHLTLQVEEADVKRVIIICENNFHVQVPRYLNPDAREDAIKQAFVIWKKSQVMKDIQYFVDIYVRKLNLKQPVVKLSQQKRAWGTCNKNGVIRINWHLVYAPVAVLEYVVAHEVVHLIHHHHQKSFWETLGSVMPDWQERKASLKSWEVGLQLA